MLNKLKRSKKKTDKILLKIFFFAFLNSKSGDHFSACQSRNGEKYTRKNVQNEEELPISFMILFAETSQGKELLKINHDDNKMEAKLSYHRVCISLNEKINLQ